MTYCSDDNGGTMLVKWVKKFENIDPKSWEHPADTAALSAVRQMKGIDELFKVILSLTSERSINLLMLASSVKVTERQYAAIHSAVNDIVETFDWNYKPTVFISQSPVMNAGVLGVSEPFIILNNAVLRECSEAEIKAILAHEMGHIMSGHALYKTVIWILTNISASVLPIPGIVIYGILLLMSEWNRKSELTADRVELLALQDDSTSYNLLVKMAGATDLSQVNINDFFLQAQEYENQKSLIDSIHKVLNSAWNSHPYPVIRLQELKAWEMSGSYRSILDGNYLRRDYHEADIKEEFDAAYNYYKDEMKHTEDPIFQFAGKLGESVEKTAADLAKGFEPVKENIQNEINKAVGSLKEQLKNFLKTEE
jgi:Zn-dependent protease with chaperone function